MDLAPGGSGLGADIDAGLCEGCRHAEILRSKQSAFLWCGRSRTDERFARYPRLPVVSCVGFEVRTVPQGSER